MASVDPAVAPASSPGKLSVFISYSRKDLAFADQLDATLRLLGYGTAVDRHGIAGGEQWQARLGSLIRDAETVVFVLTPDSAASDICAWEVEHAVNLGKRILPVLPGPLGDATPPPALAQLHFIYCYAEPTQPGSSFGTGLTQLVTALDTDLDWLREHTRLLQRAVEWNAHDRSESRLLFGDSIADARAWMSRRPKGAPEPSSLHFDLVRASEEGDARRRSAERLQLEERARLLAQHEAAQKREVEALAAREKEREAREAAQAAAADLARKNEEAALREAAQARRLVRWAGVGLAVVTTLLLAVAGAGFWAYDEQKKTQAALEVADTAQKRTSETLDYVADRLGDDRTRGLPGFDDVVGSELFPYLRRAYLELAERRSNNTDTSTRARLGELRARERLAVLSLALSTPAQAAAEYDSIIADAEGMFPEVKADPAREEQLLQVLYSVGRRQINHLIHLGQKARAFTVRDRIGGLLDPRAERSYGVRFHHSRGAYINAAALIARDDEKPTCRELPKIIKVDYDASKPQEQQTNKPAPPPEPAGASDCASAAYAKEPPARAPLQEWFQSPLAMGRAVEADARKALAVSKNDTSARELLGIALFNRRIDFNRRGLRDEARRSLDDACQIFKEAYELSPRDLRISEIRAACLNQQSAYFRSADTRLKAEAMLDEAERSLKENTLFDPTHTMSAAQLALTYAKRASLINMLEPQSVRIGVLKLQAIEQITRALAIEGGVVSAASILEDAYDTVATFVVSNQATHLTTLEALQAAVGARADQFPEIRVFNSMAADVGARIGTEFAATFPERARAALERAVPFVERSRALTTDIQSPSERYATLCSVYSRLFSFYRDKDVDRLVTLAKDLIRQCEPVLNAHPWDFYLRSPVMSAYRESGLGLHKNGRSAEAVPYLEYSSKWGDKDASTALAELFEKGAGGLAASPARAAELRAVAGKQSMKRFTVPTDFAGVKHPFHVYVLEWPKEFPFEGIEDQAIWVKEMRGGDVPRDVRESFIKLHRIARQNNVSFPDLAIYALSTAADEKAKSGEKAPEVAK